MQQHFINKCNKALSFSLIYHLKMPDLAGFNTKYLKCIEPNKKQYSEFQWWKLNGKECADKR